MTLYSLLLLVVCVAGLVASSRDVSNLLGGPNHTAGRRAPHPFCHLYGADPDLRSVPPRFGIDAPAKAGWPFMPGTQDTETIKPCASESSNFRAGRPSPGAGARLPSWEGIMRIFLDRSDKFWWAVKREPASTRAYVVRCPSKADRAKWLKRHKGYRAVSSRNPIVRTFRAEINSDYRKGMLVQFPVEVRCAGK